MTAVFRASKAWRSVCMTLAALALVIKVAVPAGYMIDSRGDQGLTLVLCTAQGAVTVAAPHADHHSSPEAPAKASHDAPCAFAGHGAAFVAADLLPVGLVEHYAYAPPSVIAAAQVVPGRGLAAPPLPARGPPAVA